MSGLLSGYFDTTTGPKREAESYHRIASALGMPAREMLFISDVVAELDAARDAGMQALLCVRGDASVGSGTHPVIRTFDEIS